MTGSSMSIGTYTNKGISWKCSFINLMGTFRRVYFFLIHPVYEVTDFRVDVCNVLRCLILIVNLALTGSYFLSNKSNLIWHARRCWPHWRRLGLFAGGGHEDRSPTIGLHWFFEHFHSNHCVSIAGVNTFHTHMNQTRTSHPPRSPPQKRWSRTVDHRTMKVYQPSKQRNYPLLGVCNEIRQRRLFFSDRGDDKTLCHSKVHMDSICGGFHIPSLKSQKSNGGTDIDSAWLLEKSFTVF